MLSQPVIIHLVAYAAMSETLRGYGPCRYQLGRTDPPDIPNTHPDQVQVTHRPYAVLSHHFLVREDS
jgi:hypothetical protein